MVLVLRGGRRYGGDTEQDVRVCLGQSVHNVALVALGGECVLAPAHLRQPSQPEVHLLRRDGRGGRGEELAGLDIVGIVVKYSNCNQMGREVLEGLRLSQSQQRQLSRKINKRIMHCPSRYMKQLSCHIFKLSQ